MDQVTKYISKDNITKYSVMGTSVMASQQLVGNSGKKGWKYWAKMSGVTVLGLVGGSFISDIIVDYQRPNVVKSSSSTVSTSSKESDVSGL